MPKKQLGNLIDELITIRIYQEQGRSFFMKGPRDTEDHKKQLIEELNQFGISLAKIEKR